MAHPSSSERYSSHISTTDDSISSGAYPSAADRARYPDLYPTAEEVIYSSQRASQPTEITPASQQLLLDCHDPGPGLSFFSLLRTTLPFHVLLFATLPCYYLGLV